MLRTVRACCRHVPSGGLLGGFIPSVVEFAANNAYRDLIREDRHLHPVPLETPFTHGRLTVVDTAADADVGTRTGTSLLQEDRHRSLWRVVDALPGAEQDVLTLIAWEGLTGEEPAGLSRPRRFRQPIFFH